LPVVIVHEAQVTCDRCGKQTTFTTSSESPEQVDLPANWRRVQMFHPDSPENLVHWVLHPACARDFQEKFVANLDCPTRDPAT
jgi:hypothetical protein